MAVLLILVFISSMIAWGLIALAISQAGMKQHNEVVGAALKLQNNDVTPFGKIKCKKVTKKS